MSGPQPQSVSSTTGGFFHPINNLNYITQNQGTAPVAFPVVTDKAKLQSIAGRFRFLTRDQTNGADFDQIKDEEKMMFLALHAQLERIWKYGAPKGLSVDGVIGNRIVRPDATINVIDFILPGQ